MFTAGFLVDDIGVAGNDGPSVIWMAIGDGDTGNDISSATRDNALRSALNCTVCTRLVRKCKFEFLAGNLLD